MGWRELVSNARQEDIRSRQGSRQDINNMFGTAIKAAMSLGKEQRSGQAASNLATQKENMLRSRPTSALDKATIGLKSAQTIKALRDDKKKGMTENQLSLEKNRSFAQWQKGAESGNQAMMDDAAKTLLSKFGVNVDKVPKEELSRMTKLFNSIMKGAGDYITDNILSPGQAPGQASGQAATEDLFASERTELQQGEVLVRNVDTQEIGALPESEAEEAIATGKYEAV